MAVYIPDSYMEPLKRDILEKLSAKTQRSSSVSGNAARFAALSSISVGIGNGKLSVEFSPAVRNYSVKVSRDVDSVIIAANPKYPDAAVSGTGEAALDIGSNVIEITVTSPDGKTKLLYYMDIIRE